MTAPTQPHRFRSSVAPIEAGRPLANPNGQPHPARARRPLVSAVELATYLGDTERHVRKLIFERRIPVVRVGGKVRFNLDAIDAWLDEHTEAPEPLPRPTDRPRW